MKARALVFRGEHYGTLSAIRSLGSMGVEVTLADPKPLCPGALSRYLSRRVTSPDFEETDAFLSWMDEFGAANQGCFLYPVTDRSCWIFAEHGDRLRKYFNLPYPDATVIRRILFKPELNRIASSVGVACPETWMPVTEEDIIKIAAGPDRDGYVVKPKTQLGQRVAHKGFIVKSGRDLLHQWNEFQHLYPSDPVPGLLEDVDVVPMIQRYIASSVEGVFSVAGYTNQDGSIFKILGAVKTLQRPARMGIGLCFESYTVDPALVEKVRKLCLALGYFGLFEVEFLITTGGEPMVIDFNCRYYSQIGFDIKRGLDSVRLAYSNGSDKSAIREPEAFHYRYALAWYLVVMMVTQTLLFRWFFVARWATWLVSGRGTFIDTVAVKGDLRPLAGDILSQIQIWVKYPRASFRTLFDI